MGDLCDTDDDNDGDVAIKFIVCVFKCEESVDTSYWILHSNQCLQWLYNFGPRITKEVVATPLRFSPVAPKRLRKWPRASK